MVLLKVLQILEINFWGVLILLFQKEGPLMKMAEWLQGIMQKKSGYIAVMILVWSAIGFLLGIVLGRILWMLQL